jgi:hypothetical protein
MRSCSVHPSQRVLESEAMVRLGQNGRFRQMLHTKRCMYARRNDRHAWSWLASQGSRAGLEIIVELRILFSTGVRVKCQVSDRVLFWV